MLRLLILLECDQCKSMLTSTPQATGQLSTDWTEEIYRLECAADENCWSIYRDQHICPFCLPAATEAPGA